MRNIIRKSIILIIISLAFGSQGHSAKNEYSGRIAKNSQRQVYLLNQDWEYLENNINSVRPASSATGWKGVDLPHSWNALDATDNNPGYRRSAGWYRYELAVPKYKKGMRWVLKFEGVNITSEIYVNGRKAGGHVGGYVGFEVDITKFIKKGKNILMVRADNSVNPNVIPSQKSDFFIFGGITRDVWLQILPPDYIQALRVSTPTVSEKSAETVVALDLVRNTKGDDIITGRIRILDSNGIEVIDADVNTSITAGKNTIEVTLPELKNPRLWSPDSPYLYTVVAEINLPSASDKQTTQVGYRWFEFVEGGPFMLNGQRLLLRGTHRHEEWAGLGNAMPNELHRRDMEMIKEMGANFVRLAHYPQDPEVYRACDELGLLVWDELPWCRGGMGGPEWQANTLRLFKEQIYQNYNHPSIIIWSVGNELYWLPDLPGGDNPDSLQMMVNRLNDLSHELDPGRLTAMRKYYDGADITDVFSPSIWAGWYSGVYKTYELALEKARKKYPRLFHAEYGGSSHVGRHTETPITGEGMIKEDEWDEKPNMVNIKNVSREGEWSESYIVDLFDWHLSVSEKLDWFPGSAQWAFKDFGTPLRPENCIPYINQKGLVDRDGNPKDAWYVFRSYWTTDPKFCYIESHTWTERFGPEGLAREVCVYSNCDKVQLTINGQKLESKVRDLAQYPASGLNWEINFVDGENELVAEGFSRGQLVSVDSLRIQYYYTKPGKPAGVDLSAEKLANGNYLISARVVDKNGRLCPEYNKRVYFDMDGSGKLVKYLGTPTGSDVIEFASGKAAIEFIPGSGNATIEARTQDFKGSYITLAGM